MVRLVLLVKMVLGIVLVLTVAVHPKAFPFQLDSAGRHELEFELDAYYSAADYIFALTAEPIPKLSESEQGLYSYMITNLSHPRFGLVEASINPMPLAGVGMKRYANSTYNDAVFANINWIDAVTAGFPEPGALAFFLGNVVDFVDPATGKECGKGYSGALLSVGNYHIVQNRMVPDYWAEGEIKLKGSDLRKDQKLSWSFRVGSKVHSHDEIRNSFYASITRSRTDFDGAHSSGWTYWMIRNSEVEWRVDMNWDFRFTRLYALAGKKWPNDSGKWAFSLSFGVLRLLENGYTGKLAEGLDEGWGVVVRPNIVF